MSCKWLWLLAAISGCTAAAQQPTPLAITMDDSLFHELGQLADTATIEHARCLYGWARPDSIFLSTMAEPVMHHADANVMNVEYCQSGALAFWHNHIPADISINGQVHATAQAPEAFCYLSRPDMESSVASGNPVPLEFVGVNKDIMCYWLRWQIAAAMQLNMLPAFPMQRTYKGKAP